MGAGWQDSPRHRRPEVDGHLEYSGSAANAIFRGVPHASALAQQDDENGWPAISGRGQDSAVGRFGETAPRFGGSPNRPTAEVSGHLVISTTYSDFLGSPS